MFMDKNPQERVINKINDISDFCNQSCEELETIRAYNSSISADEPHNSTELQVNPALKIIGLNIEKMN